MSKRRFDINPSPLRIVPKRMRAIPTDYELSQSVRCQAATTHGGRCFRVQTANSEYCWQHAAMQAASEGRRARFRLIEEAEPMDTPADPHATAEALPRAPLYVKAKAVVAAWVLPVTGYNAAQRNDDLSNALNALRDELEEIDKALAVLDGLRKRGA